MKKLLSLCMAMLLILTALFTMVACQDDGPGDKPGTDKPNTGTPGTENPGTGDPGTDNPGTQERLPIDYLPTEMYGTEEEPRSYHILEWTANGKEDVGDSWIPWEEGDVETVDGDILGEAVFNRNALVEAKYGIDITKEYASVDSGYGLTISNRLQDAAQNSDDSYQLATHRSIGIRHLIENEMFVDMNEYDTYLRTDNPWWVKDSVASLKLGERLFVAASEILLRDKGSTAALYFNQDLAKDYEDMPNFFEAVRSGDWTMQMMIEAGDAADRDVDGNTLVDSSMDIWGATGNDDFVYFAFNGAGLKFAAPNEDGLLEYHFASEDNNSLIVMQDIFDEFVFSDWFLHSEVPNKKGIAAEGQELFVENKALFKIGMVKDTTVTLRNMVATYGILPYPKYNELQDEYSSLVYVHHDSLLGIPAGSMDREYSAVILEALSYESYYTVYPMFYEDIMMDRAAKDLNSKDMLEKIFQTRSYDPGLIWDGGENETGLHGGEGYLRLSATGSADVAHIWATFSEKVEDLFDSVNEWILGGEIG